jgi:universal stress protein A
MPPRSWLGGRAFSIERGSPVLPYTRPNPPRQSPDTGLRRLREEGDRRSRLRVGCRGVCSTEGMTVKKIQTIVVGVSEMREGDPKVAPPGEDPVLAPAAALADGLGATLHVVQAFERAASGEASPAAVLPLATPPQRRREGIERCLWAQTRRFPNADRIHGQAVEGSPAIQLCAFAVEAGADLLIVGATRRNGIWHNFLGSTAEGVLQRSPLPVLVVRHPFSRPVARVLLATDLSETSPALHDVGRDVVESVFGAESLELRTLLVCGYDESMAARVSQDFLTEAAMTRLRQFLAERRRRSCPVVGRVRIGNASTEVLREAGEWKADLLVLGSHGRGAIPRPFLGSTAAAVLRAASGNALVIPASLAAAHARGTGEPRQPMLTGFPGTEEHHEPGVLLERA